MCVNSPEMEVTARRAGDICEAILDLIEALPDAETNGYCVLLALAWATGCQIAEFPDGCRTEIRQFACDRIDDVIGGLEKEGLA
jgi:hypothetical protein